MARRHGRSGSSGARRRERPVAGHDRTFGVARDHLPPVWAGARSLVAANEQLSRSRRPRPRRSLSRRARVDANLVAGRAGRPLPRERRRAGVTRASPTGEVRVNGAGGAAEAGEANASNTTTPAPAITRILVTGSTAGVPEVARCTLAAVLPALLVCCAVAAAAPPSAAEAHTFAVSLARRGPRPAGSVAERKAHQRVAARFRTVGLRVGYERSTCPGRRFPRRDRDPGRAERLSGDRDGPCRHGPARARRRRQRVRRGDAGRARPGAGHGS